MKKPKRSPHDPNPFADLVNLSTPGDTSPEPSPVPTAPTKNPHAVALGKLGGQKGGKARAAKLSAEARRAIATKAAKARWAKRREKTDMPV